MAASRSDAPNLRSGAARKKLFVTSQDRILRAREHHLYWAEALRPAACLTPVNDKNMAHLQ
jgi:hypothetical protein